MAKNNALNLNLPSADDLFRSSEQRTVDDKTTERVVRIPLSELYEHPDNPYKVRDDVDMQLLLQRIETSGMHTPAIVRPRKEGGYEIISGHRRKYACEKLNLPDMAVIVREIDDDAAIIAMVDTNTQREHPLPSEKAKAFQMRMEAMERKVGRPPAGNYVPEGHNLHKGSSRAQIAAESGDSQTQVQRFLRLNELAPPILEMVDNGKIGLKPAVELSFLPEEQQQQLLETMQCEEATPSLAQAQRLRKFAEDGRLDENSIFAILTEEKPNQKEKITLPREKIAKYLPQDATPERAQEFVVKACEHYARYLQRNAQER